MRHPGRPGRPGDNSIKPEYNLAGSINAAIIEDIVMYDDIVNLPKINSVVISGDLSLEDLGISQVISKKSYLEFPNIGNSNNLYVDTTTDTLYRWDNKNLKYYPFSNTPDIRIDIIDGGKANGTA